jgi:hypothetical protein
MSVSPEKQMAFYDWQLREMDLSWSKYHCAKMLNLYNANELFIGRIWGYDDKRGILILRFKKAKFPRLKVPLTICYPKSTIGILSKWLFSYGVFRENYVEQFSTCTPILFFHNELNEQYRYLGFKNVSLEFLKHITNDLLNNIHSVVVLGKEDPPRDYLVALRNFTKNNPNNNVLNLTFSNLDELKPKDLCNSESLASDVIGLLNQENQIIIQGPPGTGKTYIVAKICEYYLNLGSRICVTALTNKTLIEVATKEGLKDACKEKKILKTNLSVDESALIPGIQNHNVYEPIQFGTLLLSTYYSLSKLFLKNDNNVHFDILIIEEASQAFLTTLAGFISIGNSVVIVGDFMQLKPIILEEKKAMSVDQNIPTLIQGLQTYSGNNAHRCYRLVNSYRLNKKSAIQTGSFYDKSLKSKSQSRGIILKGEYSNWFCPDGGTSMIQLKIMDEGKVPINAINLAIRLVKAIKEQYPNKEVAVLSAFKDTVNAIIDLSLNSNLTFKNFEIATVDRIQGMTVDLCIYIVPTFKMKFSFDTCRFNVATSRSKNGTVIIMENMAINSMIFSKEVKEFIDGSRKIYIDK